MKKNKDMTNISYSSFGITDVGRVRKENQDAFYIDTAANVYIVADGMGGLQDGMQAAHFVVDELPGLLKEKIIYLKNKNFETIISIIKEAVNELSSRLSVNFGKKSGSTVIITFIHGRDAFIAHLGDSSAYLYQDGVLEKLTRDHNIANLMAENGMITIEDSRMHPMRHMLTNYVGMEEIAIPEVTRITLKPESRILLCSDGLTGMLDEKEIADVFLANLHKEETLKRLITKANEAGGNDNITAVLIDDGNHDNAL